VNIPKRRNPKTAAELLAELNNDPEYLKLRAEKRQEHSERFGEVEQQIASVVQDLRARGYKVDGLDQLWTSKTEYKEAVPVLVDWLRKLQSPRAKEAIVRALSVPWAKEADKALIKEFEEAPITEESGLKWAIGNALSVIVNEGMAADIIRLSLEPKHGSARQMIVLALANIKQQRAVEVLRKCLQDEQVSGHAVMALGRISGPEVIEQIEPFLRHPKPWIREEAARAIAEIKSRNDARE
jgi:hypothetical protein